MMKAGSSRVASVAAYVLFMALGSAHAALPAPPPAEAFGEMPRVTNVAISPNGKLLAWLDNSGGSQAVVMFDLQARAQRQRVSMSADVKVRSLDWSDDDTLLIRVSITQDMSIGDDDEYEMFRTLAADVKGGPARMLLLHGNRAWATGAALLALHPGRPKKVIMEAWDFMAAHTKSLGTRLGGGRRDAGWMLNVFEVDTQSGNGRLLDSGSPFTLDWVVDRHGQPVARSEWEAQKSLFRVLRRRDGGWQEIHRQQDGELLSLVGLTQDGSALLALGANGKSRSKLWTIPLDGSGARVLLEDPARDVEAVEWDEYTQAPIAVQFGGVEQPVHWLDEQAEARHESLSRTFAGRDVVIAGRSADAVRVIATVSGPSIPATHYLVDFSKGTADIVGEDYPALAHARLGEVRAMSYKARDGVEIPAYLALPPGLAAHDLPLVVLPHGGPESRDELAFDWMTQFLATRGYLVLQPQFRGSVGFGEAFRLAGYRQWGRLMQDDVTDGVKALIEQGLADPHRVCIVGASYGGYAALAGAAFTPELYTCAISVNGVSDLLGMLAYVDRHSGEESDSLAYWKQHIGPADDPNVRAKSPVRAAAQVRAPILLLHSIDDTVVPLKQSEAMARALKKNGKAYELVKLEGEDHWLSHSESRIRVLKEFEVFLAAHLGGAAE